MRGMGRVCGAAAAGVLAAALAEAGAVPAGATTSSVTVGGEGSDGALWVHYRGVPGFAYLGGRLLSAPAIVHEEGVTYYFVQGSDGNVWVRTGTLGWSAAAPTGSVCQMPAAAVNGRTLMLACQGTDNQLWVGTTQLFPGVLPHVGGWTSLGGVLTAGPAVALVGGAFTFLVVGGPGPDGNDLYRRTLSTGYVHMPENCVGQPALGAVNKIAYLACVGTTNLALYVARNTGSGWTPAGSVGGSARYGPGLAVLGSGAATVFVEGADTAIWRKSLSPTGSGTWILVGGSVRTGVGAAETGD